MSISNMPELTLRQIDTRVHSVPLGQPIVGKVGEYRDRPFILMNEDRGRASYIPDRPSAGIA